MESTHYILQFRDTNKPVGKVVNVLPKPIKFLNESIKNMELPCKTVAVFKIKMKNQTPQPEYQSAN